MAAPDGSPLRFSCDEDMRRVHALRAASDGILVGVGTVLADDPHLTVKPAYADGASPVRVVLDTRCRTPPGARVLDDAAETWIVHGPGCVPPEGATGIEVPLVGERLDLEATMEQLSARGIGSLLVEGGEAVLRSFLQAGIADVWTVYRTQEDVGGDGPALPEGTWFPVVEAEPLGEGMLWTWSKQAKGS